MSAGDDGITMPDGVRAAFDALILETDAGVTLVASVRGRIHRVHAETIAAAYAALKESTEMGTNR